MTMVGSNQNKVQIFWITVTFLLTVDACSDTDVTERWKDSLNLLQGCRGMDGPPGLPGALGERGLQGLPGLPGIPGKTGQRGVPGEAGRMGVAGLPGHRGDKGDPAKAGPRNCGDLQDLGLTLTGWYYIYPNGSPLRVMCDMETDGGGWIVFQRRSDGSVNFYRDWDSYKQGFGNQWSEFWLGNENIHTLTAEGSFQLRIDLGDFENNKTYATYSDFWVGGESEKYTLHLGNYTAGSAGDSLSLHNNMKFSTYDNDNDFSKRASCTEFYNAPWWHHACYDSSLNGVYLEGEHKEMGGIAWEKFRGIQYSLKFSEMKFRPIVVEEDE